MPERIVLKVSRQEAGQRLDVFLSAKLGQASRSTVRRWIDSGHVTVRAQATKASHRVNPAPNGAAAGLPDRGFVLNGLFSTSQFISLLIVPASIVIYLYLRRGAPQATRG